MLHSHHIPPFMIWLWLTVLSFSQMIMQHHTCLVMAAQPHQQQLTGPETYRQLLTSASTDHLLDLEYNNLFAYQHNLRIGQRRRALVSMGANLRLRRLIGDLQGGKNVSIGILGGSVSWGFYMNRGVNDWFALFTTWLQKAFPNATITAKNGCVPATTAEYASMCLDKFVNTNNVDLVFLEYALNDGYVDTSVRTEHALAFERLIRKLLQLPRKPAVALMQVLGQGIRTSPFFWSIQDHYGVLAQYYQLPWLSMRDAMYHEVLVGMPGFTTAEIYPPQEQDMQRHPSELGHKYMADVAVAMVQQVYLDTLLQPMSLDDTWSQRLMQVPEPLFADNFESKNLACFVGESLPAVVIASQHWSWANDGTAEKPKWGFSTTTVGAVLQIRLDTRVNPAEEQGAEAEESSASRSHTATTAEATTVPYSMTPAADGKAASAVAESSAHADASSTAARAAGAADAAQLTATMQQQQQVMDPFNRRWQTVSHMSNGATTVVAAASEAAGRPSSSGNRIAEEPAATATTRQQFKLPQQPAVIKDETWWEAQQAQEEEQNRSKMEQSYRGWMDGDMLVWVGYTKTWKGGGRALLTCTGGCSCANITVDAHHRWKTTQSFMAKLYTQQAANCVIQVEALPQTSSGGTFFKVSGVMVTRRVRSYDGGDYTDVLLLNAIEGEEYKLKTEGLTNGAAGG